MRLSWLALILLPACDVPSVGDPCLSDDDCGNYVCNIGADGAGSCQECRTDDLACIRGTAGAGGSGATTPVEGGTGR